MGRVVAEVRLYNPYDEGRSMELKLLVDADSTYTWVKRGRLEELGMKPSGRRRFKTIGRIVERDIGEAVVECMDRRATTVVVFAEDGDNEVLGLHALEGLSLEVDPVAGRLKEAEAILAV